MFGVAQALESAAAPITAFLIATIAEFWVIPYMESSAGQGSWGGCSATVWLAVSRWCSSSPG